MKADGSLKTDLPPVNILIVDDNEDNLTVLEAVLVNKEYNLIRANSGLEAIALASCHDLACILLDVQMPGMDGFETAMQLRKTSHSKEVPIIFVTAIYSEEAFVHQGYQSGAVDYIFKPFNPTVLQSKVSVFVDLHKKTQLLLRQSELIRQREVAELKIKGLEREWAIQEKYRTLVESIDHCIIWSADPISLGCTFVSARVVQLTGYSSVDWSKSNFFIEHIFPEDQAKVRDALKQAQLGEDVSVEHRFLKKTGEILWFYTSLRLARSARGEPTELRGLSVDVTDTKNAIEIRDQFLSIASHELLTPLTSLKLQLQMMRKTAVDGTLAKLSQEKGIKMFDKSDKQLDRVSGLIENLLNVSRINLNHMNLEIKQTDLRSLIQSVIDQFSDQVAASGSSIEFEMKEDIIGLWDPFRLEQVMVNLLTNAIKYGGLRPIKISISALPRKAILTITDGGIGIAEDDQNRIFGLFERAVSANHYGGLGLGLYIVKNIIEKHKGKIKVSSRLGQGSSFTIELPLDPENVYDEKKKSLQLNIEQCAH